MKKHDSLKLRQATPKDNRQLLDLIKKCPTKDGLEFYVDKSPDYFTFYNIQNCKYCVLVCEKNGKIVGSIGSIIRTVYINGDKNSVVLIGDLYILPEYRKGYILARLMKGIIDHYGDKYPLKISSYEENNVESLITTDGRLGFPKGELLCEQIQYNLIHLFKLKTDKQLDYLRATDDDISELVSLYNEYYGNCDFTPRYTEKTFREVINGIPDLNISNFWLVKRGGEIVSVTATWDGKAIQNITISKLGFIYKLLSLLLTLLSILPGFSYKKIKKGFPVEFLWHSFYAYKRGDELAFINLLKHINNRERKSSYLSSFISFDANDNLNKYLEGFLSTKIRHKMYLFSTDKNVLAKDFIYKDRCKFIDYTFAI